MAHTLQERLPVRLMFVRTPCSCVRYSTAQQVFVALHNFRCDSASASADSSEPGSDEASVCGRTDRADPCLACNVTLADNTQPPKGQTTLFMFLSMTTGRLRYCRLRKNVEKGRLSPPALYEPTACTDYRRNFARFKNMECDVARFCS